VGIVEVDSLGAGGNVAVGFVHRRLAVIDLEARSNQPMRVGKWWITFNGEIYNFRALREELGGEWKTEGDTEVVLRVLMRWGVEGLTKLDGMFALAAWDGEQGRLILARDRMGQKPLLFSVLERDTPCDAVSFGSDFGAVMAASWVSDDVSKAAVGEYLRWGYVPSPRSVYEQIWKVRPGEWWVFEKGNADCGRYFNPNEVEPLAGANLRAEIEGAVESQLVADVPVGCFLSGGMDSSIVAAGMVKAVGDSKRVRTFCAGFGDPRYDERTFARQVAGHLGTTHVEFEVNAGAAEALPLLARMTGEPFGDSSLLPTYLLSKVVREHVTVALSGDGGDELFGGYERYAAMELARKLAWVPGKKLASLILPGGEVKSKVARVKRFLAGAGEGPGRRYGGWVGVFDRKLAGRLMGKELKDGEVEQVYEEYADRGAALGAMATDRVTYLPDDLLNKVDRASMAVALEVRSPFMNERVVRAAAGLAWADMWAGGRGKRALARAYEGVLPAGVFTRAKSGFGVPVGEWWRGEARGFAEGALFGGKLGAWVDMGVVRQLWEAHQGGQAEHGQRIYALVMLGLWAGER
jgi:asparagine synthase (glutamine-hydrolysing)